jgi:hypothetical protein
MLAVFRVLVDRIAVMLTVINLSIICQDKSQYVGRVISADLRMGDQKIDAGELSEMRDRPEGRDQQFIRLKNGTVIPFGSEILSGHIELEVKGLDKPVRIKADRIEEIQCQD